MNPLGSRVVKMVIAWLIQPLIIHSSLVFNSLNCQFIPKMCHKIVYTSFDCALFMTSSNFLAEMAKTNKTSKKYCLLASSKCDNFIGV